MLSQRTWLPSQHPHVELQLQQTLHLCRYCVHMPSKHTHTQNKNNGVVFNYTSVFSNSGSVSGKQDMKVGWPQGSLRKPTTAEPSSEVGQGHFFSLRVKPRCSPSVFNHNSGLHPADLRRGMRPGGRLCLQDEAELGLTGASMEPLPFPAPRDPDSCEKL